MAELDQEIAAFEAMRQDLEAHHRGKWALIRGSDLIDKFDTFDAAANAAVTRFGRGPYLIRQIGAPPVILPASAMYTFPHARD
jgi:hypothetical protein